MYAISKPEVRELFDGDWTALSNNIATGRLKRFRLNLKMLTCLKLNLSLLIHQWLRNKQEAKVRFLSTELPGVIMF